MKKAESILKKAPKNYDEAERLIRSGKRLTREEIAYLIQAYPEHSIPPLVRDQLVGLLLHGKAPLPRGRKGRSPAAIAWTLVEILEIYSQRLPEEQREAKLRRRSAKAAGDILPRGEPSPSERAAQYAIDQKGDEIDISVKTFFNLVSMYIRPWLIEEPAPPDEFDPPDHIPAPDDPESSA